MMEAVQVLDSSLLFLRSLRFLLFIFSAFLAAAVGGRTAVADAPCILTAAAAT